MKEKTMTPDKNFRMWKSTKVAIALAGGTNENRAQFKRMMIDAQLTEEAARRASLKTKDKSKSTE